MKLKTVFMRYIIILSIFFLTACSSGSSGGGPTPIPYGNIGYSKFNESAVTMLVGDTTLVTLSFIDSNLQPGPGPFYMSESNIVMLNPEICTLNFNNNPPTCQTTITAIGVGATIIYSPYGPGQPLTVTVTN